MQALSQSEALTYTESHRALLKSSLQSLNDNFCTVMNYLKNRKEGSTKIKKYQGSVIDPVKFYEDIAEVTWLTKWICKGILTDIEPLGKNKEGPDAKLKINGNDVFCEVKAINVSLGMERLSNYESMIEKNISKIGPKYHIIINTSRKLNDCDVVNLSEFIKKEIERNKGKNHFKKCYDDNIHLEFVDSFSHYVEICYIPPLEEISSSTIDIEGKLCKAILPKIFQLNKAGDGARVLVLDYGRYFGRLELDYWMIDNFIQGMFGRVVPLGNNILKFSSLPLKELSALIIVPHTFDQLYTPTCYINDSARFTISEKDIAKIACM